MTNRQEQLTPKRKREPAGLLRSVPRTDPTASSATRPTSKKELHLQSWTRAETAPGPVSAACCRHSQTIQMLAARAAPRFREPGNGLGVPVESAAASR